MIKLVYTMNFRVGDGFMTEFIKKTLKGAGVGLFAPISLEKCTLTRKYKLERCGLSDISSLNAIMIAVPYLVKHEKRNISAYAAPKDYHAFFKGLFDAVIPLLEREYPDHRFVGFADDSPIDERSAAAMAGLGIIGDNGMLITEKYSSYVFLGEIITDLPIESAVGEIKRCEGCGKCKLACPMAESGQCLSALTQKKGVLSNEEQKTILKHGYAWGCDICQEVCPHTKRAIADGTIYTDIEFFKSEDLPFLTVRDIDDMSDGEFAARAYSWRGRQTIRRNLELFERDDS